MKVIAENPNHGTKKTLVINRGRLPVARARKLRQEICPKGCDCFRVSTEFSEIYYKAGDAAYSTQDVFATFEKDGAITFKRA